MSQRVHGAFEKGEVGVVAFIDLSKAYDRVWRRKLLARLIKLGLRGRMLAWIRAFLSGRSGRVRVGSERSSYISHDHGIPQGSILSPLLFNIFLSSLFEFLPDTVLTGDELAVFADDLRLMSFHTDVHEAAWNVNRLLQYLHVWARANRMVFDEQT